MNQYQSERSGVAQIGVDPYQRALRQQKEDLLAIATSKAGETQQNLMSKVNQVGEPFAGGAKAISDTKDAIQKIRQTKLAQRVLQSKNQGNTTRPNAGPDTTNPAEPRPSLTNLGSGDGAHPGINLQPLRAPQPTATPLAPARAPAGTQPARLPQTAQMGASDAPPPSVNNMRPRNPSSFASFMDETSEQRALPSFADLGIEAPKTGATTLTKVNTATQGNRDVFGGAFSNTQAGSEANEFARGTTSLRQGSSVQAPTRSILGQIQDRFGLSPKSQAQTRLSNNINNIAGNAGNPPRPNPHSLTPQTQLTGATADVSEADTATARMGGAVAKVASTSEDVMQGVSTGLGVAGEVMDALGPIGDLVGLGLSIFGGIEGHKAEEAKESAEQTQQQAISAPVTKAPLTQGGATLKTAGSQQVGMTHY